MSAEIQARCPYCGERVELEIDEGGGQDQRYLEDCPVCCRPWTVHAVASEDGEFTVALDRQDD